MSQITANTYDTASGRITGYVAASVETVAANVAPGQGLFVGPVADTSTHYIASDPLRIEARPTLTPPAAAQATGWAYDMTGLPAGTTVTVRNEVGDVLTITDLSEALTLTEAGTYGLSVAPPFPWVGFDIEIEVSDA